MAKEVLVSIDLDEFNRQLDAQTPQEDENGNNAVVRTSVFTLGKDKNVSNEQLASPDLTDIEVLKDGLHNPYLQVNWRLRRSDVDSGRVTGFDVYRKKLRNEDSITFLGDVTYDRSGFDKIAKKSKKVGKFSEEKKVVQNIKRGSIPLQILNNNLYQFQLAEGSSLYQNNTPDFTSYRAPLEQLSRDIYQKVASINCSRFFADQKNTFVVAKDRNFVELFYRDKSVGYQETFEYYVETITKEYGKSNRSNFSRVSVVDMSPIKPPLLVSAKQVKESEINISVSVEPKDLIYRILVFRKREDELNFIYLSDILMVKDSVVFTDDDINYGVKYTYRVFCQNIHGVLSEPTEVEIFSSAHKIIAPGKSNTLKTPIISAVQDQNSEFIKLNIFPNDELISYYQIERRDLTIKEKKFTTPSDIFTNYGGTGWTTNKFFVEKIREEIENTENSYVSKMSFNEIEFIDQTVQIDHIYQYRIRGYDLFGNGGPYSFSLVRSSGKKILRTPINIRSEVLRGFPFRIKLKWEDDNTTISGSNIDPNLYKVQRRKINENVYETFPATTNKFLIDEVPAPDAVNIDGVKTLEDNFEKIDNVQIDEDASSQLRRSFKLPNFLQENQTYYYRIIALTSGGDESNATEEFKVISVADISEPLNFGVEVQNTKMKPIVARLFWENSSTKSIPDYWIIERKFDVPNDTFKVVGRAYLQNEFLDYDLKPGNTYLYRIKSLDTLGRTSVFSEARLTI